MASAPTWKMADAPKGTLPLRQMTSREGGYDPESVYVPAFGYEHHGSEFLHKKHTSIVQQFYEKSNQRLIVDSVLKYFEKQHGSTLTASQISSQMVNIAMRKAFEIYGTSPENVSQARVGPSESLTYESQAPPSLYDIDYGQNDELAKLNVLSATLLRENIISERALLGRYQEDLSGAIHVLEYPTRPGAELRRGHQLDFHDYDAISSETSNNSGLGGNRLTPQNHPALNNRGNIAFPNRFVSSVRDGPNVTHAYPMATRVGWSDADVKSQLRAQK